MSGTEQTEVPMIQRRHLGLTKPLNNGEDRRVDEANVRVGVTLADFPNPPVIVGTKVLDQVGSSRYIVQQCDERARTEPLLDPVINFDQDGSRDDQRFGRLLDKATTCRMIGVAPID